MRSREKEYLRGQKILYDTNSCSNFIHKLFEVNFTHFDLSNKQSGQILEMRLAGSAANIRLMDNSNFQNYIGRKRCTFYGGLIKQPLYSMQIPFSGHWHVVVDLHGLKGTNRIWIKELSTNEEIAGEYTEIIEISP